MAYSKGGFADQLGVSRGELEARAKAAGFDTTEAFFNATGGTGITASEMVQPALSALTEFGQTLQANLPGEIAEIESAGQQEIRDIETERARQESGFGIEEQKAQQARESAVAQARRQGNELMQGIQSRFGGTTGTGAFGSEILGREVLRSVAQERSAYNQAMLEINNARANLGRQVNNLLESSRIRASESIERLKRDLKERLSEINVRKGELESQKATERMQLMLQARQLIQQQEESQLAYERELEMQAREQANNLEYLREQYNLRNADKVSASVVPEDAWSRIEIPTGEEPWTPVPGKTLNTSGTYQTMIPTASTGGGNENLFTSVIFGD